MLAQWLLNIVKTAGCRRQANRQRSMTYHHLDDSDFRTISRHFDVPRSKIEKINCKKGCLAMLVDRLGRRLLRLKAATGENCRD
jgi:hypothetical protein